MRSTNIPALGYAVLGLLYQKPSSGYDVRKVFATTALGSYSGSPGAIYPALQRLEKQGLIRGGLEDRSSLRRKQVFRLTPKGISELKKWIMRPVTQEEVMRASHEIMLRFAFAEVTVGEPLTIALLKSLANELEIYVGTLREQWKMLQDALPTSARLAFECGIRGQESFLAWARYAMAEYEKLTAPRST